MRVFRTIAVAIIGLVIIGIACGSFDMLTSDAQAQDTLAEPVAEKSQDSPALKDFKSRLGTNGVAVGPFDIVVSPTDKGANGIKYTKVPYIQFLYSTMIAFPVGKRDRWGNQDYLYVTNYTVLAHKRTNPAERTK